MPSKSRTSKTLTKNIRFSHAMLEQIENVMKAQKTQNFSAWVKEACRDKIRSCPVCHEE
ncbi:DUF3950 domain-containing protein [Salmonella enterica]|nr:DUF3950 domain-containing protein [Salmonella enterica subsp. enterica serovar Poona]EAA6841641.1 DUF3950 domain-containing protein [Salmonella enterica subsp. enterica serovar Pensacola]EAO4437976.1 DUF3950 domain-containing protein [Salmonella enterica]ECD7240555.1 DUF3950 domain-containing protein [Salmonella enterica subsp. enterica serovar Florida]ECW9753708.1 DUF3950 domain-containing protein [Salmonella enterica subsp. enterica serovar Newport]